MLLPLQGFYFDEKVLDNSSLGRHDYFRNGHCNKYTSLNTHAIVRNKSGPSAHYKI